MATNTSFEFDGSGSYAAALQKRLLDKYSCKKTDSMEGAAKPQGGGQDQRAMEDKIKVVDARLTALEGAAKPQGGGQDQRTMEDKIKVVDARLTALEASIGVSPPTQQLQSSQTQVKTLASIGVSPPTQQLQSSQTQVKTLASTTMNPPTQQLQSIETQIQKLLRGQEDMEKKMGEMMNALAKYEKGADIFHAFLMPPNALTTKDFSALTVCKKMFISSPSFAQDKCVYTVPEDGFYEFYIRWRQTGKDGCICMIIYWNDTCCSELGSSTPNDLVKATSIRRLLKRGCRVWLSAMVQNGTANLETADFSVTFLKKACLDKP